MSKTLRMLPQLQARRYADAHEQSKAKDISTDYLNVDVIRLPFRRLSRYLDGLGHCSESHPTRISTDLCFVKDQLDIRPTVIQFERLKGGGRALPGESTK
jgi:hypothetical protein